MASFRKDIMSAPIPSQNPRYTLKTLPQVRRARRRRAIRFPFRLSFATLAATGVAFITMAAFGTESAVAATATVNLGTAASYAVLAGSTITNTGSSVIAGDIGLSPGSSITGFPPGVQSSGVTHTTDAAALGAENDLGTAYLDAAGRTPFTTVAGGDLGGSTLVPGVYETASAMALTGTVTLNGGGDLNSVFIFQAGSTLITASSSTVALENGAQACHVFWQVGSSATLGTATNFAGTILALTSATLDTSATVSGRVLARNGAVTLDSNTISVPTCRAAGTTTTTLAGTTTTVAGTTTTAPGTTTTAPGTTTTSPGTTTTSPGTTTTSPGTTTTAPASTTTSPVIPLGAPGTGFGGSAGSGSSPLRPLGFGALGLAGGAGFLALRARRRQLLTQRYASTDRTDES
jgi:hypothetical protein